MTKSKLKVIVVGDVIFLEPITGKDINCKKMSKSEFLIFRM